jgi:flavin reductase (DIM6/NTAB) family NADH-FMN oxidoreductase RutF
MAKINWKGSTLLGPLPTVMVSCGTMEKSNIITVAWTGILNTHPPRVSVAIRPTRHSYAIIKERGEFVINLTPARLIRECDYCGIYTGAKVDKFAKTGLHKTPATAVAAPLIEECPLALECKVLEIIPQGTHDLFLAEIVAVDADESVLDENGKLCLDRAGLAAFAHGEYFALGEKIGKFGFSAAKQGRGKAETASKTAPRGASAQSPLPPVKVDVAKAGAAKDSGKAEGHLRASHKPRSTAKPPKGSKHSHR